MAVNYTSALFSAQDANGRPLVGGRLFTYQNRTTTPAATYLDAAGTTPNTNPVILNARGEATVYLLANQVYRFVLQDRFGAAIWSQDGITGVVSAPDLAGQGGSNIVGFVNFPPASVGRTVQGKLQEWVSLEDIGGDRNGFAPAGNSTSFNIGGYEAAARLAGSSARVPVLGADGNVLPNMNNKIWYTPDSVRDRATAMSVTIDNQDGQGSEPTTQINGFTNHSDVSRTKIEILSGCTCSTWPCLPCSFPVPARSPPRR